MKLYDIATFYGQFIEKLDKTHGIHTRMGQALREDMLRITVAAASGYGAEMAKIGRLSGGSLNSVDLALDELKERESPSKGKENE